VFRIGLAYYSAAVLRDPPRRGVLLGHRADAPRGQAAIASVSDDALASITYPRAVWDEEQGRLISDAEVAEVPYTAFGVKKKRLAVTARLIIRRVRDLSRRAAEDQDELFTCWCYHAVLTDSPFEMIQAEAQRRDRAVVEQVFVDLSNGPLAHLPSGQCRLAHLRRDLP
jgi:hypothetical protein